MYGPEPPNHNPSDDRHLAVEDIPNLKEEQRRQIPQKDETSLKTAELLTKKGLRAFPYLDGGMGFFHSAYALQKLLFPHLSLRVASRQVQKEKTKE